MPSTLHPNELKPKRTTGAKTSVNNSRVRNNLISLVLSNLSDKVYFYTFTFAGTPSDGECSRMFTRFLRYNHIGKYIYISEYQKRGILHYHLLKFNEPILAVWEHGYYECVVVPSCADAVQTSLYLCKYLVKDGYVDRPVNSKAYICSKDITRPVDVDFTTAVDVEELGLIPLYYSDKIVEIPTLDIQKVSHAIYDLANLTEVNNA